MHCQGAIADRQIDSRALSRRMLVRVITPPGYAADVEAPYPVLFFLHPWGLSPHYITDKLHIHHHLWDGIAAGDLPPMVIVLPTGHRSFYLNAADPPGYDWSPVVAATPDFFRDALDQYGRYGDYLLGEVVPFVEREYTVRCDRAGRALGGISMGGAAAAVHAFRDPARFCAVGIHSPALFMGPPEEGGPPWIFGVERASFAARNPADLARSLDPAVRLRIFLDTGDQDMMVGAVRQLHQALADRGVAHDFGVNPGEHNKTYWEPRMREYLAFYARGW